MGGLNREVPRFSFFFTIMSNEISGTGINVSMKGIGFLTEKELVPASEVPFKIEVKLPSDGVCVIEGLGSLIYSRKKEEINMFMSGFEFIELTEESKRNISLLIEEIEKG